MSPAVLFFVAAGSGGHINPAVTLAQKELHKHPDTAVHYFTGASDMEVALASKLENTTIHSCGIGKFNAQRWWELPRIISQIVKLIHYGYAQTKQHKASKIISTGSLLSLPICLGAWLAGAQVDLYELNVELGKAIKALLPIATHIHCCFGTTMKNLDWFSAFFKKKFQYTSYPIRFARGSYSQADAITHIASTNNIPLSSDRKTIVVLGGSQGSVFLNESIIEWAQLNTNKNVQFIHQAGRGNAANVRASYEKMGYTAYVFEYDHAIDIIYSAADVIICRAGAGTLFEIVAFSRQALVLPLSSSTTNHQQANAQAMADEFPQYISVVEGNSAAAKKCALRQKLDTLIH